MGIDSHLGDVSPKETVQEFKDSQYKKRLSVARKVRHSYRVPRSKYKDNKMDVKGIKQLIDKLNGHTASALEAAAGFAASR